MKGMFLAGDTTTTVEQVLQEAGWSAPALWFLGK